MTALAFPLAVLLGWALVRALRPAPESGPAWARVLLEWSLGASVGIGLSSLMYFVLLWAGVANRGLVLAAEAALLVLFLVAGGGRRRAGGSARLSTVECVLLPVLLVGLVPVALGWKALVEARPHGQWDAFAIWNLRARYLAGADGAWRHAVSPELVYTRPDYPLLIPAFVAGAWSAAGDQEPSTAVPIALAAIFATSAMGLLISSVALLQGAGPAMLAGLVMLSGRSWLFESASLGADVPLSFYLLAALALILLADRRRGPLLLAGLAASLAAWTKNEGSVFLALVLGLFPLIDRGRWIHLAAGAAPGTLLVLGFKLFLAPANYLATAQSTAGALSQLLEADRYGAIAKQFGIVLLGFGQGLFHPLALLALVAAAHGMRRGWFGDPRWRFAAALISLLAASYLGVYLVTPFDVRWQVSTSMARLACQLWPAALLIAFRSLRPPVETAPPA